LSGTFPRALKKCQHWDSTTDKNNNNSKNYENLGQFSWPWRRKIPVTALYDCFEGMETVI